ncbi:MAG: rRNA pseudouridine synthase [Ruminococcaceae bacterium]|nr:rRNA pseudouridine synthase [Oscillospiraceae bacterium]
MEVRLQKFFTDQGVLSRRAAEAEIIKGSVTVNGEVAVIGMRIDPERDTVVYRGKEIKPRKDAERLYLMLHKPRGFVTTLSDEKGRRTIKDLVADLECRVYPVGRLDMDSDGLLLLTDDGEFANRLTHPRHEIPKHYLVTVRGSVSAGALERLSHPFLMDGYETLPVEVCVKRAGTKETQLTFSLYEGRNRQIRRMCEEVGLSILSLTRVAIGELSLGDLPLGKYRHLTEREVAYLKGKLASCRQK